MKQLFFIVLICLVGKDSFAHQPDLSTSVFSTTKDGQQVLQITSSLTAFEGEINFKYGEESYSTPEEFQKLVVDFFKQSVHLLVNDNDSVEFARPLVILGHESKLVVEVLNLPNTIESFNYQNQMFKDMPHNQMAVMFMIEGFPNEQLVLNNDNKQTLDFELNNGEWRARTNNNNTRFSFLIFLGIGTALIGIIGFIWWKIP